VAHDPGTFLQVPVHHVDVLPLGPDNTEYRQLDLGGITPLRDRWQESSDRAPPPHRPGQAAVTDINTARPSHLAR